LSGRAGKLANSARRRLTAAVSRQVPITGARFAGRIAPARCYWEIRDLTGTIDFAGNDR